MEEFLCSIHNYTKLSSFPGSFFDIAQAALDCGLDAVFCTDRNVYAEGHDQYYYRAGKRMLLICGEELSDPVSDQIPSYLSLGTEREQFNRNIQNFQNEIRILLDNNPETGQFRHIEMINAQDLLNKGLSAGMNDIQKNIDFFDSLLLSDKQFTAIAGTCSHFTASKYTYQELFSTACNHIISDEPLNGDFIHDKLLLLKKIKNGNLYLALDGLNDAHGFRFSAEGDNSDAIAYPGDSIHLKNSITLKIICPESCTCRLIRNGKLLKEWYQCKRVPYTIYEPGYYRVECALTIRRTLYTWILSNPIYAAKG